MHARARVALAIMTAGAIGACAMAWHTSDGPRDLNAFSAAIIDCDARGLVPHVMTSGRVRCYPPALNTPPSPQLWPRTPSQAMRPTP